MSIAEELNRLSELHRQGGLTDTEFAQAKARVLQGEPWTAGGEAPVVRAINNLRRSRTDRWVGGVCGGLAQLSGLAAWVWRLGFLLLALCGGTGVVLYLLLWIFIPDSTQPLSNPPKLQSPGSTG